MNDILNILSILEGCCMFLTFGQLAGLIAALAFLVLVIYLCRVLARLTSTVSELTKSIKTLTEDADDISEKIEDSEISENQISGRVLYIPIEYSDILNADGFDSRLMKRLSDPE